jgi:hypothetical protein
MVVFGRQCLERPDGSLQVPLVHLIRQLCGRSAEPKIATLGRFSVHGFCQDKDLISIISQDLGILQSLGVSPRYEKRAILAIALLADGLVLLRKELAL